MATCYYPNGDPSPGDIPCSTGSGDSMCCPLNWNCEKNGLCSLASQNFYGRYTCTDKTWSSSACPKSICTENLTAAGDEAVLQCSAGSYCCDTNRPTPGCCDTAPTSDRFQLAQLPFIAGGSGSGSAASSSTSASSVAATTSASSSATSSASASSSATAPILKSISLDTSSSASSAVSSATSTSASVLVITSIVTSGGSPASTLLTSTTSPVAVTASVTPSPSSNSKHLASIVGPAVAVPTAILAVVALAFFLFWRSRRSRKTHPEPRTFQDPDNLQPMYGETKPTIPVTENYKGKPELEGSPQLGGAAGYSPSTAPPSYRGVSGMSQTPNAMNYKQSPELDGSPVIGGPGNRGSRASELAASPATGSHPSPRESAIPENPQAEADQGPSELPGSTFRPYRPPGLGVVNA